LPATHSACKEAPTVGCAFWGREIALSVVLVMVDSLSKTV
jgi:hypothetical protein